MSEPFIGSTSEHSWQQLRSKRYTRLTRDVYVTGEVTLRRRAEAALLLFPEAVLCGRTAALVQKLPVQDDGSIHLSRGLTAPLSERAEITNHRLDILSDEVLVIDGLAMTDGPRTLADLARELSVQELVEVGDPVLRRFGAADVAKAVDRAWGRPGVVTLREAATLLDGGSASPAESRCRVRLHRAGFTELRHGLVIRDQAGEWLAEPDLADARARVAVQHEGEVHFSKGQRQRMHDVARDELSREQGWEVVVSTAVDDADPSRLIRRVAAAYRRAAARLGSHVLPRRLRAA
jgi:hypothetical protein